MSCVILSPAITDEMTVKAYDRLVNAEVRRIRCAGDAEFRGGMQDGYVMCLSDMLGKIDEEEMNHLFDQEKTYSFLVEKIVEQELTELTDYLQSKEEVSFDDMVHLNDQVSEGVRRYAQTNMKELRFALSKAC